MPAPRAKSAGRDVGRRKKLVSLPKLDVATLGICTVGLVRILCMGLVLLVECCLQSWNGPIFQLVGSASQVLA